MNGDLPSERASLRAKALGALTIFVPLFFVLLWYAFQQRAARSVDGFSFGLEDLPTFVLWLAAALAAGGPSVVLALFIANRDRLRAVFRLSRGKILHSLVLGFFTPMTGLRLPLLFGPTGIGAAPAYRDPGLFLSYSVLAPLVLALAWYPVTSLLISGIRPRFTRFLAFALVWWSIWGAHTLAGGSLIEF